MKTFKVKNKCPGLKKEVLLQFWWMILIRIVKRQKSAVGRRQSAVSSQQSVVGSQQAADGGNQNFKNHVNST
jgi:hypothetical protein